MLHYSKKKKLHIKFFVFIVLFLVLFFAKTSFAAVTLGSNKPIIEIGQSAVISATIPVAEEGTITFHSEPAANFSPPSCVVPLGTMLCITNFSANTVGTYTISATKMAGPSAGGNSGSNQITVEVKQATTVTPNQSNNTQFEEDNIYTLLEPIGDFTQFDASVECPLANYLNTMIKILIGLAAVFAMVMIVIGGLQYVTSELISSKSAGKEMILNAVIGLLIALSSWLILKTINPQLLDICLKNLPVAEITLDGWGEGTSTYQSLNGSAISALGAYCPNPSSPNSGMLANVAESFDDKVTYSMPNRGAYDPGPPETAFMDCSYFVNQVYDCAGYSSPGSVTGTIFPNSEAIQGGITQNGSQYLVNGQALKVGDLLGWMQGDNGAKYGHVIMYIGNGQIIEVRGPSGDTNNAVKKSNIMNYDRKSMLKYIKRI